MANSTDPGQIPPHPAQTRGTPPPKGPEPDGNVKPPQKQKSAAGAVAGTAIGAAVAALSADD
jgi:hypothetical protein